MKKNFYLIEAYFLGHIAIIIFSKYFLPLSLLFQDILNTIYHDPYKFATGEMIILAIIVGFILLKKKYELFENNGLIIRIMYFFVFLYVFFMNYAIFRF